MPICRPSAAKQRLAALLALASAVGLAATAVAQVSPGTEEAPPARSKIEIEGDTAMERLRSAVERRKFEPLNGPGEIPQPSEAERRRAFEAMRNGAKPPAMDARAR